MVRRSLFDIAFSDANQLLVGCREQLGQNDSQFDSKILHCLKTVNVVVLKFLFEKIDRNVQLNLCFSKILNISICFRVRQVALLSGK